MLSRATAGRTRLVEPRPARARDCSDSERERAPILRGDQRRPRSSSSPDNPKLLHAAVEGGRAAFRVNCVQCHGSGAAGIKGYPNLNDDDWLWGGDLDVDRITHRPRHPRNPEHDATRMSQMPAFGRDGILQPDADRRPDRLCARRSAASSRADAVGAARRGALRCRIARSVTAPTASGNRAVGAPNLQRRNLALRRRRGQRYAPRSTKRATASCRDWSGQLDPVDGQDAGRLRPFARWRRRRKRADRQPVAGGPVASEANVHERPVDRSNEAAFTRSAKRVFPKAVDGRFRRLKWLVMAVTLTIYYVTPWLRWDRGPYAPDQAVLVDLAHRRFYMFGRSRSGRTNSIMSPAC